jgi:hypothetical protein
MPRYGGHRHSPRDVQVIEEYRHSQRLGGSSQLLQLFCRNDLIGQCRGSQTFKKLRVDLPYALCVQPPSAAT